MPEEVKVSIEEVQSLKKRIGEINRIPFDQIVWTKGGEQVVYNKQDVEEFRFTGLANVDFVFFVDPIEQ